MFSPPNVAAFARVGRWEQQGFDPHRDPWSRQRRAARDANRSWRPYRGDDRVLELDDGTIVELACVAVGEQLVIAARTGRIREFPFASLVTPAALPKTSSVDVAALMTASHRRLLSWFITAHLALRTPVGRRNQGLAASHEEIGALVGLKKRQTGTLVRDLVAWQLVASDPLHERYGAVKSRRANLYRVTALCVLAYGIGVPQGCTPAPDQSLVLAQRVGRGASSTAAPDRQELPAIEKTPVCKQSGLAGSAGEDRRGPDPARGASAACGHEGATDANAVPAPRAERVKARPDALAEASDEAGAIELVVVYDAGEHQAAQRGIRGAVTEVLEAPATRYQRDDERREREDRQRRASLERERQRDRDSGAGPRGDVDEPTAETDHATELAPGAGKKPAPLPTAERIEQLRRAGRGIGAELMTADELETARKADLARARKRDGVDDSWLEAAERAALTLAEKTTGKRELRVVDAALFSKLRGGRS